jgi:poly-gamma-glutamate capsule biosynthesis protein CapA/YwtB (metallophosphatase superfamily)
MPGTGTVTLALLGDAMLGRGVGERIARGVGPQELVPFELVERMAAADLRVLNLECCISTRGTRWPALGKPFFFRAPPAAVDLLCHLGADLVTLANNHALDYGFDALRDTLALLAAGGIESIGAGEDLEAARRVAVFERGGLRVAIVAFADHPADFAAGVDRPGTAYAELDRGLPDWVRAAVADARRRADVVVVTPHWGPNMNPAPRPSVLRAADELLAAGASFVAGHSAHVFQGVRGRIAYDLGDFLDDYAVDPLLRNDLGLLWLVRLGAQGPIELEAVPLRLGFCATRLATGDDATWIADRFVAACRAFGTPVSRRDGSLRVGFD